MNDAAATVAELPPAEPATRWELAPTAALVDHIVTRCHERLRASLLSLVHMARTVEELHRDEVSCPIGLAALLEDVQRSVLEHLQKEEVFVFPAILESTGASLSSPLYVMELEHEHHKSDLLRIHALTDDLTPPADACATWRALYAALRLFEQALLEHIELENTILFRRALAA